MSPAPPGRLEFTDCLVCGKRVATTATLCRHCNTQRNVGGAAIRKPGPRDSIRADESDDADADSHAALSLGGYGNDDYPEDPSEPTSSGILTGQKNLWWFVALVLLIFFLVSALLPQIW